MVAGGAALLASGLIARPTEDLDLQALASDPGFDPAVLAQMMRTIGRFDDREIPIPGEDLHLARSFFAEWADELDQPRD